MKIRFILFSLLTLCISCSSDDSNGESIDRSLLDGTWYFNDLCREQNNIVFSENVIYTLTTSGNQPNNNEWATVLSKGIFQLNGNNISFEQQTQMVIREGDSTKINSVSEPTKRIYEKIVILSESKLFIERKFKLEHEFYRNWSFIK